jgi:hypothetical protein
MEGRTPLCLVAELQRLGATLRVQGGEHPGHGAARVHHDPAQKVFMRWILVSWREQLQPLTPVEV